MCHRLDTIPACDRQTDGQTDGQTSCDVRHSPRYAYASRGNKMHHLGDKARYWSKIVIFFIPPLHSTPPIGGPRRNIACTIFKLFDVE